MTDARHEGPIESTIPMLFSGDETTDLGSDSATPVSDDYGPRDNASPRRIRWVQIDLDPPGGAASHFDIAHLEDRRFDVFVGFVFGEDFRVRDAWEVDWGSSTPLLRGQGPSIGCEFGRSRRTIRAGWRRTATRAVAIGSKARLDHDGRRLGIRPT